MNGELATMVADAFAFLSRHAGCHVIRTEYAPRHFGNELLEFECDEFRLRFTRDRSDCFVEIATIGSREEWFSLDEVADLLNRQEGERDSASPWNRLGAWLESNWSRVAAALSDEEYETTRQELLRRRRVWIGAMSEKDGPRMDKPGEKGAT
jgi:hypothetical protein